METTFKLTDLNTWKSLAPLKVVHSVLPCY